MYAGIQAAGYRGSVLTVRRYVRRFRATAAAPQRPPTQYKVREVVGWIMPEPGKLKADDQTRLQALLDRCPELNALAGHVRAFAEMMSEMRGDRLQQWIDAVEADDLPRCTPSWPAFAAIRMPSAPASPCAGAQGPVEGHVNRLKMLMRQMFGRAKLDLLRRRVLATR